MYSILLLKHKGVVKFLLKLNFKYTNCFSELTKEEQEIVSLETNTLVTANPGTGKTYLLALKCVYLIASDVSPEDILCLTFTNKAKTGMEDQIHKILSEKKINVDLSKLNVYTFHSFALDYIDDGNIITTNLLRFVIYEYLKEKEVLNYEDSRLVTEIVPKLENLMRYMKSYGILPDSFDTNKVKTLLSDLKRSKDVIEKKDLERFLDYFTEIFKLYEKKKENKGIDYADLLINFLKIKHKPKYKYILVDELQDVNSLEAQIALECGDTFFAVGDKKQAIFGFQGGSIENFKQFKERAPKEFNLIVNRRSTQQILDFASLDFNNKSIDDDAKKELTGLNSFNNKTGKKPLIIEAESEDVVGTICSLLNKLSGQVAILVRTNGQILDVAKALKNKGIDFSSTHVASSVEAKENIIRFIKGVFSLNPDDVKNAFFTPYFPISLENAFKLTALKNQTLEQLLNACPEFKKIREQQKDLETINKLFIEYIYPISIAYGEEYLLATQTMHKSIEEVLTLINEKTLNNLILYLEACDLESSTAKKDAKIILTTVHKAKGLGYDKVIYWPKKMSNKNGFQDYVVEKILESCCKLENLELSEETLRIDFVAYTRAKEELYIITEKATDYLNQASEKIEIEPENTSISFQEKKKRAYSLFINKNYEDAKELLEQDNKWLINFVKAHFVTLEHISFSRLTTNPYEYFTNNILQLREDTYATDIGNRVHNLLEIYLKGETANPTEKEKPFFDNGVEIIKSIRKEYPEFIDAEHCMYIKLSKIIDVPNADKISFKGKIDAVFKNKDNKYLIVDWKTSKSTGKASEYRRQLELYKRAYAEDKGIAPEQIEVAIGFIGLRKVINDGDIHSEMDNAQPRKTVYKTLQDHFTKFLDWKNNPLQFLEDLSETKVDDPLIRSIIEQWQKEKN